VYYKNHYHLHSQKVFDQIKKLKRRLNIYSYKHPTWVNNFVKQIAIVFDLNKKIGFWIRVWGDSYELLVSSYQLRVSSGY